MSSSGEVPVRGLSEVPHEAKPSRDVPHLLDKIASNGKFFVQGDAKARKKALAAARELCFALETPVEAIIRICWAEPALFVTARIATGLNLFEKMVQDGGKARNSLELATLTGADPVLMGRILKHLVAMGVVHEPGSDRYAPTELARALAIPKYRDGIPFCFDCVGPPFVKMPEYLAKTGYKNPESAADGPFQYGHNSPLHFFEWLKANPAVLDTFNNHMMGYRQGRPSWMDPDFYPVEEGLGKGFSTEKDAVMLVDVGGGKGHDLEEFQSKHPSVPGRLILQEQPVVIKDIKKLHKNIETMEHDFHTPQPIKGARAYYMHSVLHDWPDEKCREILLHLMSAMTPGYSKILINENVIPDKDAHWMSTSLDLYMMAFLSSRERTEVTWRALLNSVGLKVVKIWNHEPGTESLIEAELP